LVGRANGAIRLVSLLQPPPETVALFDELILVDSGRVIYSGPLVEVVPYFESLGYFVPDSMDVADWLQVKFGKDVEYLNNDVLGTSLLLYACFLSSRYPPTKVKLS
jgi:hypothetical protein